MNYDIFHAYDVRGVYPDDFNENDAYLIARGYNEIFHPATMAVGMDARKSSPPIKKKFIQGLLDAGVNVVDIGEITTDMLYFAVGKYGFSGGAVISASHNPGHYNGIKLVGEGVAAVSSDAGLFDIRECIKKWNQKAPPPSGKGTLSARIIMDDYITHVLSFIDEASIGKRELKIVGNGNFGFVSRSMQKIIDRFKLNFIPMNFEPDGTFPKGPPDPMLPDNRTEIEELVRRERADLGVAWDGDADRVMFFNEKGEFTPGVYVTSMLSELLMKKYGPDKIVFDPRIVWPIQRTVKKMGGTPIMSKAGHSFIKERMRKENGLFGGELSAHYFFRDNFFADNGIIPFLLVLEQMNLTGLKFSEMTASYKQDHHMSGEQNFKVSDAEGILGELESAFGSQGKASHLDGLSVETDQWRFNVRPSNTEPLLRVNIEARSAETVDKILRDILSIIES